MSSSVERPRNALRASAATISLGARCASRRPSVGIADENLVAARGALKARRVRRDRRPRRDSIVSTASWPPPGTSGVELPIGLGERAMQERDAEAMHAGGGR